MIKLDRLSKRERFLVLFAIPITALVAGYYFAWQPLAEARADTQASIVGFRSITQAADAVRNRPDAEMLTSQADIRPIATRVTSSAEEHDLAIRRLEPEGQRLRVSLVDADFAEVLGWIADLEAFSSVRVVATEMDRRPEPGIVAARLTLEPAS